MARHAPCYGTPRTVLGMLVRQALVAGIEQVAVVIAPGDQPADATAGSTAATKVLVE